MPHNTAAGLQLGVLQLDTPHNPIWCYAVFQMIIPSIEWYKKLIWLHITHLEGQQYC